jgi:hypothetical protein
VLDEDVIKDETSIVFVVVKSRTDVNGDVEDIEEVEVKVEVDEAEELARVEEVVVLAAPGGSTPFLPAGPLTGVPRVPADAAAAAEGPGPATAAADASSTSTRSGRPSVQASTAERTAFISKVRIRQ